MSSYIPLSKLNEGINKSVENASRYLKDAEFLYRNKRWESSILLSMLSFEEAGKALMLMDCKKGKEKITRRQWRKRFCTHSMKNLMSIRKIWQDAGYLSPIPDSDVWQARFEVDWKNSFTYADYDFENQRWTSPVVAVVNTESFSCTAMSRAADALECIIRRASAFET